MRITQGGVYVLIQKFGIENLISVDTAEGPITCSKITTDPSNETAILIVTENGSTLDKKINLFDHLTIEIKAEMVEFRRSINLNYRGYLNVNTMNPNNNKSGEKSKKKDEVLDLNEAIRGSKSKKGKK